MSKETGGAAFPCEQHETQDGRWNDSFEPGMTLRDYFAAKLMPAVIGSLNGTVTCEEKPGDFDYYAECAYKMADAMLRARGQ
ncbi:hypothetical protein O3W44_00215 [Pantoea sp. LMR881]|uniref:hypothetical protein n=1 Tax=Pantoea sp. LMR881 TaxID=3014336 RepID=UPI0022AFED94|nr:hypothetical protein [Pantoea sp. LMR881]MCZ4057828.1 hypothetical protein [Pantoea sp. LMR881]